MNSESGSCSTLSAPESNMADVVFVPLIQSNEIYDSSDEDDNFTDSNEENEDLQPFELQAIDNNIFKSFVDPAPANVLLSSSLKRKRSVHLRTPWTICTIYDQLFGSNGFKWKTKPFPPHENGHNLIHIRPRATNKAKFLIEPLDIFKVFFSSSIVNIILRCTNQEINRRRSMMENNREPFFANLCCEEFKALLGLLILSGAMKDNHLTEDILFDSNLCGSHYKEAMLPKRFKLLLVCLRFDSFEGRSIRNRTNAYGRMQRIWNLFVSNCTANFQPSPYVTVDKIRLKFIGRCPFRNNKSIEIYTMCDTATSYMINAVVHQIDLLQSAFNRVSDFYFNKLVHPIKGSKRTITIASYFASVPLALETLKRHQLTTVGIIDQHKNELPADLTASEFRHCNDGSSLFLYAPDIVAVAYKKNANNIIQLISTVHKDGVTCSDKKPEILKVFNLTKNGVRTFETICSMMNCTRQTKRWTMVIFYHILNIAVANSYVVYLDNFHTFNDTSTNLKPLSRLEFMLQLHKQLVKSWLEHEANQRINEENNSFTEADSSLDMSSTQTQNGSSVQISEFELEEEEQITSGQ